MKVTSAEQRPLPHPFYGDSWERGLDPWHVDAFPAEFEHVALRNGARKGGWFLIDGAGNNIGFIVDGTPVDDLSSAHRIVAAVPKEPK